MSRESKCQHDIAEQETAVAEHQCPLCLYDQLVERALEVYELRADKRAANKGSQRNAHINQSLVKQLEAAKAEVAELKSLRKATIKLWYEEQTRRQVAEAKVEALEEWIEQEGERGDICTFNILRKVCSHCQCKRNKEQTK